jgi:hypothetical protein
MDSLFAGLPFDIRDEGNVNLVRALTSAMTKKQQQGAGGSGNLSLDSLDAKALSNLDSHTKNELLKLFHGNKYATDGTNAETNFDEPDEVLEALAAAHANSSNDAAGRSSFSITGKFRQESFDSANSSTPSSARASMYVNDASLMMKDPCLLHSYTDVPPGTNDLQYLYSSETFEFCSVEADLNYLQALSLNATLPTYASSEGVMLGNMAATNVSKIINSIFPSRLPSVVASCYPDPDDIASMGSSNALSSLESVNSFCFPDGVAVEVPSACLKCRTSELTPWLKYLYAGTLNARG